ncbi:DUF1484 family protein [Ralstonia pseudosolanacearum]|nr:DUF1484 family protein [Ralstonia pseudosolanacearum]
MAGGTPPISVGRRPRLRHFFRPHCLRARFFRRGVSARIYQATEETGAQLLCVSAACDGILCLLDLHAQTSPSQRSLHCLPALVKQQPDGAIGTVTEML